MRTPCQGGETRRGSAPKQQVHEQPGRCKERVELERPEMHVKHDQSLSRWVLTRLSSRRRAASDRKLTLSGPTISVAGCAVLVESRPQPGDRLFRDRPRQRLSDRPRTGSRSAPLVPPPVIADHRHRATTLPSRRVVRRSVADPCSPSPTTAVASPLGCTPAPTRMPWLAQDTTRPLLSAAALNTAR